MRYDGPEVQKEFEDAFGSMPTVRQMWVLVKMIKHCRQRCRNNAALNNWLNRNFKHLRFSEVTKVKQNGETYKGLDISEHDGH
jgi:hypothetical protein